MVDGEAGVWPAEEWSRVELTGVWTDELGAMVAVGANGRIVTAQPGAAWVATSIGDELALTDVAGDGARWVAVGDAGTIVESDGDGWTLTKSPTTERLTAVWVGKNGKRAVAVGAGGTIIGRTGDQPWIIEYQMDAEVTFNDIGAQSSQHLMAVGTHGAIVWLLHGQWEAHTDVTDETLASVTYQHGSWWVASPQGNVYERGCKVWDFHEAVAQNHIHSVRALDGKLYAAGSWEWLAVWEMGAWKTLYEGHCKASYMDVTQSLSGALYTVGSYGIAVHPTAQ